MTRTASRSPANRSSSFGLNDESLIDFDDEARALLIAYREAGRTLADSARKATGSGDLTESDTLPVEPGNDGKGIRIEPGVPRLKSVAGVDPEKMASLHGQLLAAGYLSAEVVGRADGLAYRITRDGIRHLAGEAAEITADAA